MSTAMMSAADIEEVGCPEPAAVLQRMESTRSCWPSSRRNSVSLAVSPPVAVAIHLLPMDQRRVQPPLAPASLGIGRPGLLPWLNVTTRPAGRPVPDVQAG